MSGHTLSFIDDATGRFSTWLDSTYPDGMHEDLVTHRRVGKLVEEVGEVTAAIGGYFGENPRKGTTHTLDDLQGELLDVAFAALGAWEHLDGNTGRAGTALLAHTHRDDQTYPLTAGVSDLQHLNACIVLYNLTRYPSSGAEPVELTLRRRAASLSVSAGAVAAALTFTDGRIGSLQRRLLDVAVLALAIHDKTAAEGTVGEALAEKVAGVLTRVGLPTTE
ncbi:MazG-like family protein [Curtobacterium sp. MCSS17_016]|uniref:MazG-like family protein n=1 Tax=Curtobacterium sp. MCSS17_016 TaxID=2175644 RepID=UPI000DA96EB2|nr:MazG-like family protein [Curtobacterium sp. MCSS17_016]WIE81393.1 MazG-like family protein [Curtobacterium sp. MCSS17_016]